MPNRSFGPPSASLRSPDFSSISGARLTDFRIRHYMLQGYYGEARRLEAVAEVEARPKRETKPCDVSLALALLSTL